MPPHVVPPHVAPPARHAARASRRPRLAPPIVGVTPRFACPRLACSCPRMRLPYPRRSFVWTPHGLLWRREGSNAHGQKLWASSTLSAIFWLNVPGLAEEDKPEWFNDVRAPARATSRAGPPPERAPQARAPSARSKPC